MIAEKRKWRSDTPRRGRGERGFFKRKTEVARRRIARDVLLPPGMGGRTLQTSFVRVRIFKVAAEWVTGPTASGIGSGND